MCLCLCIIILEWLSVKCFSVDVIIIIRNSYIAPNPDWLKTLYNSKQEWTSESVHEACIHQTIERQQQSAGKHAHIPEQSVQPRHAVQRYMDHGNIS